MIRFFNELSVNNQFRIVEVSVFLKIVQGSKDAHEEVWAELIELCKTPKEWRRFRKDLFERANRIREKMGLRRLGA